MSEQKISIADNQESSDPVGQPPCDQIEQQPQTTQVTGSEDDHSSDSRIIETATVYVIKSTNPLAAGKVYVGSTERDTNTRLIEHKSQATSGNRKYKLYAAMLDFGVDTFFITGIEIHNGITARRLHIVEETWISNYDSIANGLNDKHGTSICIIHDRDRRRCECGGSHLCGCKHERECVRCRNVPNPGCMACAGLGKYIVYVRREQCSSCGGNQMCVRHPHKARARCKESPECEAMAKGICPHKKVRYACNVCRPCPICSSAEVKITGDPRHESRVMHSYNLKLRDIIQSRADPTYTSDQLETHINAVIANDERDNGPFKRLQDAKRVRTYQKALDAYLIAHPMPTV